VKDLKHITTKWTKIIEK